LNAPKVTADRRMSALILKAARYTLHSGGMAVVRTLGRLGIPPTRSLRTGARPGWRTEPCSPLREVGQRSVLVPMDDRAAVLIAEHAAELSKCSTFPPIAPGLPRALAGKQKPHEMCRQYSIPAPAELAWLARDDPLPLRFVCGAGFTGP
jgi:D-aspartate ligase